MSGADLGFTVNGEPRSGRAGLTLAELLEELGLESRRVAVERNLVVVPKADIGAVQIEDGDRLEIVSFVGGG